MKAFVLAAGKGRRMLPLTLDCPKPLLKVGDATLIEHQIAKLRSAGIVDIVINVAYLGEMIQQALGLGERLGVRISYSVESQPLETGGAIAHALALLGQAPFLLVNSDVWTDFPFESLARKGLSAGELAKLVLVENPEHNRVGDFVLQADAQLRLREDCRGRAYTYSGIALVDPDLVATYPKVRQTFALKEVFDWAIAKRALRGEYYAGQWSDIGTPERLYELSSGMQLS